MSPSEARKLTPAEAEFYLATESAVKASCRRMNAVGPDGRMRDGRELAAEHRDYMRELRRQMTGSEDIYDGV